MNKIKQKLLFVIMMRTLLVSSCNGYPTTEAPSMECIRTFQDFAYSGPEANPKIDIVLPPSPWKLETKIPTQKIGSHLISNINVVANRFTGDQVEIWIAMNLSPVEPSQATTNTFLIYKPKSHEWENISADVEDSGLFVDALFVTGDGSLWGKTVWDTNNGKIDIDSVPVLSKFNESTRRFEFAKGVLEIPWALSSYNFFPWPEIVLDKNNVFWIFAKGDGIYSYDPARQRTIKKADLFGSNVIQTALAPDGNIYFEVFSEKIYSQESFFQLINGTLFQFVPEKKEVVSLKIPREPWHIFSGMLVSHDNKLWLGAIGYRELNGDWHLIHPNPEEMFIGTGDAYYSPPFLMLESSDGLLWFRKFLGDVRADGTAWFNPQTKEGCMFTNIAANVVEDSEQQLWLVAEENLYKYSLNSSQ